MELSPILTEAPQRSGDGRRIRHLADPTRIAIVDLLVDGPRAVSQMAEAIGIPADRLYYHLDVLETSGLIRLSAIRPRRVYELSGLITQEDGELTQGERAEFVTAIFDLARIEIASAYAQPVAVGEVAIQFATLRISQKELDRFAAEFSRLLAALTERQNPRARRRRVILGSYPLKS